MNKAVLLTKHNKATWIAPPLQHAGFTVVEYTQYDTDELGTFCQTRERAKDGQQTAAYKAKLASEYGQSRYGLGSEGSFSQHIAPGLTWEQEIVCLHDNQTNTQVFGLAEGPAEVTAFDATSLDVIEDIVTHSAPQMWMWQDGLGTWHKALDGKALLSLFSRHSVALPQQIAPDYRAMHCPSRQRMITRAAEDLASRLTSICPKCGANDFVFEQAVAGLPCEACGLPTQQAKGWWANCKQCGHKAYKSAEVSFTSPVNCAFCNP